MENNAKITKIHFHVIDMMCVISILIGDVPVTAEIEFSDAVEVINTFKNVGRCKISVNAEGDMCTYDFS